MTDSMVVQIGLQSMLLAAKLAGPLLLTTLGIGLVVGLVQSVTQLQEPTLTFVPKFLGAALVVLVGGSWMLAEAVAFVHALFDLLPEMLAAVVAVP
jgi:flagellar biosynthetic protein FliQ